MRIGVSRAARPADPWALGDTRRSACRTPGKRQPAYRAAVGHAGSGSRSTGQSICRDDSRADSRGDSRVHGRARPTALRRSRRECLRPRLNPRTRCSPVDARRRYPVWIGRHPSVRRREPCTRPPPPPDRSALPPPSDLPRRVCRNCSDSSPDRRPSRRPRSHPSRRRHPGPRRSVARRADRAAVGPSQPPPMRPTPYWIVSARCCNAGRRTRSCCPTRSARTPSAPSPTGSGTRPSARRFRACMRPMRRRDRCTHATGRRCGR